MADSYEYFYNGGKSSLEPNSDSLFIGYSSLKSGPVGSSTGTQTANQIKDVANYLNQGMKVIEVSTISPEVFEMIPKQHMKEIHRLTKLTGAEVSVHGPIVGVEPSGFTQQGWSEQNRESSERQMSDAVIRAHEMNPDGEMPVTFHASGIAGTEFIPIDSVKLTPEEKEKWGELGRIPSTMVAVNKETGELSGLKREEIYYPGRGEEKIIHTPEDRLKMRNDTSWDHSISNLNFYKKESDEIMENALFSLGPSNYEKIIEGKMRLDQLNPQQIEAWKKIEKGHMMLQDVSSQFISFYDQARKYIDFNNLKEGPRQQAYSILKEINEEWAKAPRDPINQAKLIDDAVYKLNQVKNIAGAPQLYVPVEEFAKEKASETFANVAYNAYKKLGDKAPIVSIENPPYGMAVSTAEDLKKLIEESRRKFVEKAKGKGMSNSEAEKAAMQMIGATWDTSHISMMRKEGFTEEDLVKEAKKIAPFVKHVHLNDNFGYTHTDLPPGMGNVPIGDIMKELEKKGFAGKKIFEGGQFFQHFQTPPHPLVLEAMGSPVYSMIAYPTWTEAAGTQGTYSAGYGMMLPEQHFSMYGAGWTGLPAELGGQVSGKQSRFSGTPNA